MNGLKRVLIPGVMAVALLSACSQGMQTSSNDGSSSTNQGASTTPTNPGSGGNLDQVDMKGYVAEGTYQSVKSVDLDKQTGELILRMPLGMDVGIGVSVGNIPQLPGASFGTEMALDGNFYFTVRVPLKYVLRRINTLPSSTTLPNGRALPKMPAGEYPSVAFAFNTKNPNQKAYLYVGVDAVGLYVESNWLSCGSSPVCLDYFEAPIKNQQGNKILGFLTLMMGRGSNPGGFFVSTIIPPEIAAILDDYFLH